MKISSPTLKKVMAGETCSGCGLCAGIAPAAVRMHSVAPGYSRPEQITAIDAVSEKLIAQSCPGAVVAPWEDAPWSAGAAFDPYWGPSHKCLTGHATDKDVRFAGSSGGVLSALAIHALGAGMVTRILHVTADPAQPTRNIITLSANSEQILKGAGSRYAASSPLEDITSLLASDETYLFIGKPCDVSALRQLSLADPRVDLRFPLKLSFFCGGIPSHAGADRITQAMGLEPQHLVNFRYRGDGWPGLTRAVDDQGRTGEMRYEDSWGGHLSKEVQFRCKICPDAVGGVADIACADAWYGGETGYPQFEEADGRSLILTRTAAGETLLDSAIKARVLDASPLAVSEIHFMQPSQARRKRLISARVAASRLLAQHIPVMRGLGLGRARAEAGIKALLRDFLGTARRIVLKRR